MPARDSVWVPFSRVRYRSGISRGGGGVLREPLPHVRPLDPDARGAGDEAAGRRVGHDLVASRRYHSRAPSCERRAAPVAALRDLEDAHRFARGRRRGHEVVDGQRVDPPGGVEGVVVADGARGARPPDIPEGLRRCARPPSRHAARRSPRAAGGRRPRTAPRPGPEAEAAMPPASARPWWHAVGWARPRGTRMAGMERAWRFGRGRGEPRAGRCGIGWCRA